MAKAIGLILTLTGLMLGSSFVQMTPLPGPAPPPSCAAAAMALMMMLPAEASCMIGDGRTKPSKTQEGSPP